MERPEASKNIYIIGAGAVGKVLAVMLSTQNRKAILVRGSIDNQKAYLENIRVIVNDRKVVEAEIEVTTLSNLQKIDGTIIIAAKAFANKSLAKKLRNKTGNSPLVIMQNGLGVENAFADLNYPNIYRCVLFVSSQNIKSNEISYKPIAASPIGYISGNNSGLEEIIQQLNSPDFEFRPEDNIKQAVWEKAIVNCVFNSICPLLNADNGIFYQEDKVLHVAKQIIEECVALANELGIELNEKTIEERVLLISKSSAGQLISTLQDIRNRRKTEIDSLNLEIARIARDLGKEDLVSRTKLLGELIQIKSEILN